MKTREELKRDRQAIGWTQKDLAQKAEISLGTVINYEKGNSVRPSTEKAIRAALWMGLKMVEILIV